jgi:hypothetical protein
MGSSWEVPENFQGLLSMTAPVQYRNGTDMWAASRATLNHGTPVRPHP